MKIVAVFLICLSVHYKVARARVLPSYMPEFCPATEPLYNECSTKVLKKLGPLLIKGIPEIKFPPLDPMEVPLYVLNKTVGDFMSIHAVSKNIKIWGFDKTALKDFKLDLESLEGHLDLFIPSLRIKLEQEMKGKMMAFVLDSKAYLEGNFTNINFMFTFSLQPAERLGVKYYSLDDFEMRSTTKDGKIKIIAKDAKDQPMADLFQNTFNANPKPFIRAGTLEFDEYAGEYFKEMVENTLSSIPAEELIPLQ